MTCAGCLVEVSGPIFGDFGETFYVDNDGHVGDEDHDHDPDTANACQEQPSPVTPFWGACGVEACTDCRPLYDADNNPIAGT